jgi:hypothetical protein
MPDDGCKSLKLQGGDANRALEQGKQMAARCGCRAVTLIFKPKDDYQSVTVVCLRGGRRKTGGP